MKIWTSEHVFHHPWETVAQAVWRKYPNPMNPSVIGIDVLDRSFDNGILKSNRFISSSWGLPTWVQSLIPLGNKVMYGKEYSEVNASERSMTMKTRNYSLSDSLAVDETLTYQPHPENPNITLLRQEAVVTSSGIPLSSYVESWLASTISRNANKGRQAMEWVIHKINDEVTQLSQCAVHSTDELLQHTIQSLDDIGNNVKRSVGDITQAARKSIDVLEDLTFAPKL